MTLRIVQRPHVENFISWAKDKREVMAMSGDFTNSCEVGRWRDTYPDRFFSMGMAEQNMLGFAGGLAREGYEPFIHTFAVFIYRRAYDQLAMSVAYPNLRVRLVGFLPGIVTPGGVTHQAIEDIAVMRATPNMTILETGDATDVESVLDVAHGVDGPVYIRMLRGEMPRLFDKTDVMRFNQARILSRGNDITIFTAGITTEEALRAVPALEKSGVSVTHLHISTLKPFSDPQILGAIQNAKHGVIKMENHIVTGGLGSAVAEVMAQQGCGKPLVRLGLKDTYAHGASKAYLMREYGMDATALIGAVEKLVRSSLDIDEADMDRARAEDADSAAKAEAL